jgi:hypothetical protein
MKKLLLGTTVALLLALPKVALANSHDVSSSEVCKQGQPQCVNLVIEEMERRYLSLAELCDHDALFALNYLVTTQVFQQTLDEIGYENLASIIRLDALFADYYFRAYDAYHLGLGNVTPSWQVAFDAAQNRAVTGSGNLALGINAHIQRDLPFVLYELYLQGKPISYEDHTRINQFLVQVNPLEELARKFDPTIDDVDVPGEEDDLQRFQAIVQWRELAFRNYERLRDAGTDEARTQVAAEIEGYSAATATALLQLYSYPPGTDSSARDAYCQECQASVPEPTSPYTLLLVSGAWLVANKLKARKLAPSRSSSTN